MAEKYDLIAEQRDDQGKGASRRLRHQGKVPAIIYGAGRPPRNLSFDHNKVLKELENEAFYSSILNIKVGDKSQAAVVKDIQRHPARLQILHMDFQRIVEDEKIRMNVPTAFCRRRNAHRVSRRGRIRIPPDDGRRNQLSAERPSRVPSKSTYLALELNEMLHMSDIKLPAGVEIPTLAQGEEQDNAIVSIPVIKQAVVEEEEEASRRRSPPRAKPHRPRHGREPKTRIAQAYGSRGRSRRFDPAFRSRLAA